MKTPFESSPLATQRGQRGSSMKKAKKLAADELRSEYKRSDFGALVRGKYIERLQMSSNVVVLDPRGCRTVSERGGGQRCVAVPGGDRQACRLPTELIVLSCGEGEVSADAAI